MIMYNKQSVVNGILVMLEETAPTPLIHLCVDRAEGFILLYTGRSFIPSMLQNAVLETAIYMYNRVGTEGIKSQSLSSINNSYSEDIPKYVTTMLDKFIEQYGYGDALSGDSSEGEMEVVYGTVKGLTFP